MACCTNCGAPLPPGATFCPVCSPPHPLEALPTGRSPRSAGLFLGLGMLLIALAAGGVWLGLSPSSPFRSEETTTSALPDAAGTEDALDPLALEVLGEGAPPPPLSGSFDLGEPIEVAVGTVGPAGGVVESSDGLRIDVPAGAHARPVTYRVTRQEILGHGFGPGLSPVSALYTVDNGGGLSTQPAWVEVPAQVPESGFALGFLYDPATGGLEALPLIGFDADTVVVATGHFSQFFIHGVDATAFAALVAAEAASGAAHLGPTELVDTGFRPGVDDWPFPNYGSFVAPGGHCAGQSLSAMWYFVERARQGAPHLNDLYDNDGRGVTERWQDDRNGYRLASVVQSDYGRRVSTLAEVHLRYLERLRLESTGTGSPDTNAAWQYAAFVVAMQVTGEPQYVSVARLDESGNREGHAMIVYGADTAGLWVADPNYPGRFRRIPWDAVGRQLGPYHSGPDATSLGRPYDVISLLGKTALLDWGGLGLRFTQLELGTAGDDRFPSFVLAGTDVLPNGHYQLVDLAQGFSTRDHEVDVELTDAPALGSWRLSHCPGTGPNGCRAPANTGMPVIVPLQEGENLVEIYVEAFSAEGTWEYLDFVRVTVHRDPALELTVLPATQAVPPGVPASFVIEVANPSIGSMDNVTVRVDPGGLCPASLPELPGGATHRFDCTLTPPPQPGPHEYQVTVDADWLGTHLTRTIYTEILVGDAAAVGDIIGALNRLYEAEFGSPGSAQEASLDNPAAWSNWLTPTPAPQAVYTINLAAPVYVGVYATPEEAGAALQSTADTAATRAADHTGAGVHWCDWHRVAFRSGRFHDGDAFWLTTIAKVADTDPSTPGVQSLGQPEGGWCAYSEAEVPNAGGFGAVVVETSIETMGWVQGPLVVTLNPVWGPDTAEQLYADLQGLLGG